VSYICLAIPSNELDNGSASKLKNMRLSISLAKITREVILITSHESISSPGIYYEYRLLTAYRDLSLIQIERPKSTVLVVRCYGVEREVYKNLTYLPICARTFVAGGAYELAKVSSGRPE
jgi:hypothetical protein